MKSFLEAVSKDETLIAKVVQMDKEALIALAKELGFDLTEADFEAQGGELNNDELNAVTGGGECACVVGGGGTASGNCPAAG